jgi:hypothetical protein
MLDYFPGAKISDGTQDEYLIGWGKLVEKCGLTRFEIALDQVKRHKTDREGNIAPRLAYEFPSPSEIEAAVPPAYVRDFHRQMGDPDDVCSDCKGTHWKEVLMTIQTPGWGSKQVIKAQRCGCFEAYKAAREANPGFRGAK